MPYVKTRIDEWLDNLLRLLSILNNIFWLLGEAHSLQY